MAFALPTLAQTLSSAQITFDPPMADPGQEVRAAFSVRLDKFTVLVKMEVEIPAQIAEVTVEPGGWTCQRTGQLLDCSFQNAHPQLLALALRFRAPDLGFYAFRMKAWIPGTEERTAALSLVVPRTFRVTHGGDSGSGSLRQAVIDANAACAPPIRCRILFEVPRVELDSPLPPIVADSDLTIQGANAVIDGRRVDGHGIAYRGRRWLEVVDLAVESFGGDGINIETPSASVRLFNVSAVRNRTRGVMVFGRNASITMIDVNASENGYSGVALWEASFVTVIGGTFDRNGASGLFIYRVGYIFGGQWRMVGNAQFGISIARGNEPRGVSPAGCADNGVRNFDWGLDGETLPDSDERDGVPNGPELIDAKYDPATGTTRVRGRIRTIAYVWGPEMQATFHAGELQRDGTVAAVGDSEYFTLLYHYDDLGTRPIDMEFTVTLKKAKPGQYVSAYGFYFARFGSFRPYGTEMSRAVRVE